MSQAGSPDPARHAHYGEHWGEGAARCFSIECDILDEDHAVRLMPVPDSFVCPISACIMVDPVATVDGCVYERQYIERWFRARRQQGQQITSPITGLDLPSATLMPLVALQRAIEAYLAHRPELKQDKMAGRSFEEAAQILQSDLFEKQAIHATVQDKLKRLRQANKTLLRQFEEAKTRIIQLESERKASQAACPSDGSAVPPCGDLRGGSSSSSCNAATSAAAAAAACSEATGMAQPLSEGVRGSDDAAAGESPCPKDGSEKCKGDPSRLVLHRRDALALLPFALVLTVFLLLRVCAWAGDRVVHDVTKVPTLTADITRLGMGAEGVPSLAALPPRLPANHVAFGQAEVGSSAPAHGVAPSASAASTAAALPAASSASAAGAGTREVNPVFLDQLEQLRFGSLDEKQRAAFMLRHFAAEHAENQIAIAKAGAITPLVELLGDSAPGLREEAARALWNLARNNKEINVDNQVAIVSAGAIRPLIRLLEDEVPRNRVVAAAVLNDLAIDNIANQIAIARAGAISPVVKLLRQDEAPGLVMAASLLQSLASRNAQSAGNGGDAQVATALSGAIPPLVELLRADTLLAQEQAASTLGTLAAYNADIQAAVVRAGAIVPLVQRLKGDMMQGTAALALRNLAAGNPENQAAIAQAGAIIPLVKLLEDGMPGVRAEAARALWNVARDNFDNQVAIVRAGAAIPLVALLKGDAQEEATITLLNLAASTE
mmetsp:Transcript_97106/g.177933  ORF Transcript_97106/g.177933 Transcript_97106/m.177933 type:complete len:722 (-) Transcript_97106:79-2244(-)